MTDLTDYRAMIPDPHHRAALNAALLTHGHDSGFWDEHGRPAPWPDDIDEWRPCTEPPDQLNVSEQTF